MLYTAARLLMIEFLVGIVLGALFLNPLATIAMLVITHPLAILCAIREPHTDSYIQAYAARRPAPQHWKTADRIYIA